MRKRRPDPPASTELKNSVLHSFFLLGCRPVRPVRNVLLPYSEKTAYPSFRTVRP